MQSTSYPLKTAVINKMTIPFTIRIALSHEMNGFNHFFSNLIRLIVQDLTTIDREFSPFRSESLLSHFRNGDLSPLETSDRFAEVFTLSQTAKNETAGFFNPFFDSGYNPTGLVKGWAINTIFDHRLRPLLADQEIVGVSFNGGGDIITAVNSTTNFRWTVGIEDPNDDKLILGKYDLTNQGIATSGLNRRGEHISRTPSTIKQVTIISDSLVFADVWATAGMAAGTGTFNQLINTYQLSGVYVDGLQGQVPFSRGEIQHVKTP